MPKAPKQSTSKSVLKLSKSSSKKPQRAAAAATDGPAEPAQDVEVPLGKHLASNDKKVRDKAVADLATFLGTNSSVGKKIEGLEMRKLWKGLFYCFWMSDKPLVQQSLASTFSSLIGLISPPESESLEQAQQALDFIAGFWEAICREWAGIDRLRLDKYLMLIRRFHRATLSLIISHHFNAVLITRLNEILLTGPLECTNPKTPIGLSWHMADIYLTELNGALSSSPEETASEEGLVSLVEPFVWILCNTTNRTTFSRVSESLLTPFISTMASEAGENEFKDLRKKSDGEKVKKVLRKKLFESAGKEETRDWNRRAVFKIWKESDDGDDDE